MVLLGMLKTHNPDHSLSSPLFRTVLQKAALKNEVMSHSRTKSRLAYHLPKTMDSPSSIFHSYNTYAGIYLGPFMSLP